MSQYIEIGQVMTTEEYLKMKEQEELDKIFAEYDIENNEKARILNEMKSIEEEQEEKEQAKLLAIQKLADYESEVGILTELYAKSLLDFNSSTDESIKLKSQLKIMKAKLTKQTKLVESIFNNEEE